MARKTYKITKILPENAVFEQSEGGVPINAVKAFYRLRLAQKKAIDSFAKSFAEDAEAIISLSGRLSLHGIYFPSGLGEDADLWTKPNRQANLSVRPKAVTSVKGSDRKTKSRELHEKWANRPDDLDKDLLWQAFGFRAIDAFFCGASVAHDASDESGAIYLSSEITPSGVEFEEVLGSEYEAVEKVYKNQSIEDFL